jgi:lipopolysaccharide transport system ATP-binding protein
MNSKSDNYSSIDNDSAIVVKNLSKRFSASPVRTMLKGLTGKIIKRETDFQALNDISFRVKKGESVGILGENGSGKSTLLQIIANILEPSSGNVQTNGKLAALLELGSGFNPDFSGRENVYLNASILGLRKEQIDDVLDGILEFADIGEFVDRPISTYSSGMRMRLAFAVQVFVEPEIFIVDEALSVGDQFFKLKCFGKIQALLDKGITFLYVSHNEETLRGLTNRVLFLHHGKLAMDGGVQECIDEYNLIMGQKRRNGIPLESKRRELDGSSPNITNMEEAKVAKIVKVRVLDSNECSCHHFKSGEPIKILLEFICTKKIEELSAGLRIRNKEGVKIYSWETANQDACKDESDGSNIFQNISEDETRFTVQFDFECNLGSNLYQIEAILTTQDNNILKKQDILDWVSEAAFIKVNVDRQKNFFGGVCDLKMRAVLNEFEQSLELKKEKIDKDTDPDDCGLSGNVVESSEDTAEIVSEIMKLSPKGRILDIRCGTGKLVNELSHLGFVITGIDPSKEAMAHSMPFEDEFFDTVISTDYLEHISEEDLPAAIHEIARVTRSQLYLRISTHHARENKWQLPLNSRKYWEDVFFRHGFRLHPVIQEINPFETLERETNNLTLCLEKIPHEAYSRYPSGWLLERRDLHTDMLRESNRRSDAHIGRYQLAREICPIKGQVLDAACGMGYGSNVLSFARSELKVTGIDISKEAIEYSTNNFSSLNKNLKFKIGGVEELNTLFKNETFDMVCSFETVEHINDPVSFIHDVKNMLKPEGLFICSVPNMWVDESGKDPNPHHLHVFDFEKIISIVSEELEVQKIYSQIAGNGNKFPEKPRTLMEHNLESDLSSIEAEWCIILAKKF